MKRVFDITFALLGVLLLSPVLLLIGGLIIVLEGRPIFFRQERVGRCGKLFKIWKFRSMTPDAEKRGAQITATGDARITRIGAWLRKTKLDELPQLFNVLKGEMSFVGPRPEVPRYVAKYSREQRRVLEFTPGITDPASCRFRHENDLLAEAQDAETLYVGEIMPEKIRLNLAYADRRNLWTDACCVLNTVRRLAG